MPQTPLPASVTIADLPAGTTVTGTELFEAIQVSSAGVANSVKLTLNQMLGSTATDIHQEYVNAFDFGVVGDDFADDTAAIQAAIDYAYSSGRIGVLLPQGFVYRVTDTIWLDPPLNMRTVGTTSPTIFNFSLALVGSAGNGNDLSVGSTIRADDGNFGGPDYPILVVGPGQGMRVAGLTIRGEFSSLWPTAYGLNSIGIAISGGSGGATRTVIERCWISQVYAAIKVGWNADGLGDSNTFFKCIVSDCYFGYWFAQTQNYINTLYDCNAHCVKMVYSPVGKPVNVIGGNYSYAGNIDQDFAMSLTSALTTGTLGSVLCRFSTTLTFPGTGLSLPQFSKNAFTDNNTPIYDAYAIETSHFGVIPCNIISFNGTTNVITLEMNQDWIFANFGQTIDFTTTDIQAEIQAATTLMTACQRIAFVGQGIQAFGTHHESPQAVSVLLDQSSGFDGARGSTLENTYLNYSPSEDGTTSQKKIQSVFPWIGITAGDNVVVRGGQWNGAIDNIPLLYMSRNGLQLIAENHDIYNPNMRVSGAFFGNINSDAGDGIVSPIRGFGLYKDRNPFSPIGTTGHGTDFVTTGLGQHGSRGVVPEMWPPMTRSYYSAFMAGSIGTVGSVPILFGKTPYSILSDITSNKFFGPNMLMVSDHDFYSLGQNITCNWSYKGQTHHLYVDDCTYFFPGLKLGVDNGGGTLWYSVIGVYPNVNWPSTKTGYLNVHLFEQNGDPQPLAGGSTTVYTGATISQETYNFIQPMFSTTNQLTLQATTTAFTTFFNATSVGFGTNTFTATFNVATTMAIASTLSVLHTSFPSGGQAGLGIKMSTATNFGMFIGTGAPSIAAATNSLYMRSDGSTATTRLYVALTAAGGTTSWTAILASA